MRNWQQPKCAEARQWINKIRIIYMMIGTTPSKALTRCRALLHVLYVR